MASISAIVIYANKNDSASSRRFGSLAVELSNDLNHWTEVYTVNDAAAEMLATRGRLDVSVDHFEPKRYIRILSHATSQIQFDEIEVYSR